MQLTSLLKTLTLLEGVDLKSIKAAIETNPDPRSRYSVLSKIAKDNGLPGLFDPTTGVYVNASGQPEKNVSDEVVQYLGKLCLVPEIAKTNISGEPKAEKVKDDAVLQSFKCNTDNEIDEKIKKLDELIKLTIMLTRANESKKSLADALYESFFDINEALATTQSLDGVITEMLDIIDQLNEVKRWYPIKDKEIDSAIDRAQAAIQAARKRGQIRERPLNVDNLTPPPSPAPPVTTPPAPGPSPAPPVVDTPGPKLPPKAIPGKDSPHPKPYIWDEKLDAWIPGPPIIPAPTPTPTPAPPKPDPAPPKPAPPKPEPPKPKVETPEEARKRQKEIDDLIKRYPKPIKGMVSTQPISNSNSIKWQDIYKINKGVIGNNPNLIKPGQELKIPGKEPYIVKPGDTLSKIAVQQNLKESRINSDDQTLALIKGVMY